jgi:hypothetical protein
VIIPVSVVTVTDVFLFLLYGLLTVLGSSFVLTSAVSIGDGEGDDTSSLIDVGITGRFCWMDALIVAV